MSNSAWACKVYRLLRCMSGQGDISKSTFLHVMIWSYFTVLSNLFLFVSCTFCKLFLTWILNDRFNIKTKYDQLLSWNDLYLIDYDSISFTVSLLCICMWLHSITSNWKYSICFINKVLSSFFAFDPLSWGKGIWEGGGGIGQAMGRVAQGELWCHFAHKFKETPIILHTLNHL